MCVFLCPVGARESGGDQVGGGEGQQCRAGRGDPQRAESLHTPKQHRSRAHAHPQRTPLSGTHTDAHIVCTRIPIKPHTHVDINARIRLPRRAEKKCPSSHTPLFSLMKVFLVASVCCQSNVLSLPTGSQSLLETHDSVASQVCDTPPPSPCAYMELPVSNQPVPPDAVRMVGIRKVAGEHLVSTACSLSITYLL